MTKRIPSTLAVALACAAFGASAWAQQSTTTTPQADKKATAKPSDTKAAAKPSGTTAARSTAGTPAPKEEMAYDFARMDKNRDNYISAEEMQAELNIGKPQASASTTPSGGTTSGSTASGGTTSGTSTTSGSGTAAPTGTTAPTGPNTGGTGARTQ